MIYLGDFFALGLVITLAMFFFDTRSVSTLPSKLFLSCLIMTGSTALLDIVTGRMLVAPELPIAVRMLGNSIYFVVSILTTSCFAMYLFSKILEHVYDDHCLQRGKIGLSALFVIFLVFVVANHWNGWLFYFDEQGAYQRGPLNPLGYLITVLQMVLVMICYFRNKNSTGRAMKRSLKLSFPTVILCIIIQLSNQEIMLNGLIMALICLIIFLNFQGQRQGEHNLTKLNDRQNFYHDLENRIERGQQFQILKISIRDFGAINQKYGYKVGDEILYQCAFALEKMFPRVSSYHIGSTDFALVLPYTGERAADEKVSALMYMADKGVVYKSDNICPDYYIVNYISDGTDDNVTTLCEKLEYASSIVKAGKQKYLLCTPEMTKEMQRYRYLADRMQKCDREHGFQVWFQPVYCIRTGKFCSMEALLRLFEADGTMVPPDEFIPIAERTGLIDNITWFVTEEVCAFLAAHPEVTASVSINLPIAQLMNKKFEKKLTGIVDKYGIAHRRICLEITERAFMDDFETSKAIMDSISAAGYRFFLDDFGTGYSNFSCLLQLPFTCIKLDRSLSRDICENPTTLNMVHTLTGLFHDMHLEVIAEGAEHTDQVNTLTEHRVDRIQGYHYARPMNQADTVAFYTKENCSAGGEKCEA